MKFECGSRICEIGRRCFAECEELSCISFANCWRLQVFSDGMFQRTSLKSIAIPCSVREIGFNCFSGCSQLSRIDFDKSSRLKRICDEAFKGCAIVSLEFPSSVLFLGSRIFSGCSSLSSVGFASGSGLQYIGSECFSHTGSKKVSISVPDSICIISCDAFDGPCDVSMIGDDSAVKSAFEQWRAEGNSKNSFVNPQTPPTGIIKGSCQPCKEVGSGGQGFVRLKKSLINGEFVAVKTIDCSRMNDMRWNEMKERGDCIASLCHPCLVQVKDRRYNDQRKRLTIFMEYVEGPSDTNNCMSINLKSVLERPPPWWTNVSRAIVILGITRGIEYLHDRNIWHRDLKPSNILLDKRVRPKICDFDVARSVEFDDCSATMTLQVGTYGYMAPEATHGKYSMKSDHYSFGIVLYEIFEGIISRSWFSPEQAEFSFTEKTPARMKELIESLLQPEPDDRSLILGAYEQNPLFAYVYDLVLNDMNLTEEEKKVVNEYVEAIKRAEANDCSTIDDLEDGICGNGEEH